MAQTSVKVKGVVTSEADGFPLTGVNVVQKGSTNGVVTDLDGNFELTVPVGSVIEVSYIGFIPQTQQVTGGASRITLIYVKTPSPWTK
ncbi:hypothetical protein AGMMS49574_24700 [Bacteroidia bacterium]|nr:hypothetical protein AGMMS49574_24700 [Bacteroidia bacterium]